MQRTKRQCWHRDTHTLIRTHQARTKQTNSNMERRARAGMHFISFHIFSLLFLRFGSDFWMTLRNIVPQRIRNVGFFFGGFPAFFVWFLFCGCVLFQNECQTNKKMRKCGKCGKCGRILGESIGGKRVGGRTARAEQRTNDFCEWHKKGVIIAQTRHTHTQTVLCEMRKSIGDRDNSQIKIFGFAMVCAPYMVWAVSVDKGRVEGTALSLSQTHFIPFWS